MLKKLAQQTHDEVAKRRVHITSSAEGKKIIEALKVPRVQGNNALFANFTEIQKMAFYNLWNKHKYCLKNKMSK